MSSKYLKIEITYDNNCGTNDTDILYAKYNNSLDYQTFVDESGEYLELAYKTDDWMDSFKDFLCDIKTDKWSAVSTSFLDLPEEVQKTLK